MASSHQQGNGHLEFISNSPYFFKIILLDTIKNGKLGIPRKFAKNHGNGISSPALLRVPSGAVWKVVLTKCDGKIWLENGWLEFSNHYSLELGHLLVFRYDGNSNFHVVIFDRSASEIQYPYTSNNHRRSNMDEFEDDDSIQIIEDISPSRKMREKSQSSCPQPHKMIRITNSSIETKTETECNGKSGFLVQQLRHNGCPARKGDKRTSHRIVQRLKAHEKVKALEIASNTFKSENPFFLAVMQPSYVGLNHDKQFRLAIPANFVRKYLMKEHCFVTLCNSSGKSWIAIFKRREIGKMLNSNLQTGWDAFVRDNNIQVGDVCAFELINSIETSFKVVIYQGQHANCHQSLASEIQHPYTSNNHRRSDEILEQNIEESEDDDTIQILEDISPSRKMREKSQFLCPRPHKMMRSTNSAIKTITECNGKYGFLTQQVRHNGCPARNGDKTTSHNTIQRLKTREKDKAIERVCNTFNSENPFFLVVMQPDYVGLSRSKQYRLTIPRNFVEKHLMKEHCSIILCSSSVKTWIATLKQRNIGKKLYSYLQNGWGTFVRDNDIQVGDVCAFELINSIEISFKVLIFKGQHANCHQSLTSTDVFRPVKRKPRASRRCPEPLTALEKAKAFQIAGAFKSENPFFVIILQPSYVNSYRLSIPVNFARQYLTKMHKEVILLLSNGKLWPVIYYQHSIEKPNVIFGNGWRKFALDNNLEVGDACVFELIKGAETTMKVTIYKKQAVEDANLGSSLADKSGEKQVELHESLVIKTESAWMKEKGDMSNLLVDYNCDASEEILDDILMSKISSPGKAVEEASQSYQTSQKNEAIQDTNR